GKLRDGDHVEIVIDRVNLTGSVDLLVNGSVDEGTRELASRPMREDLAPDPALPEATRLWAVLQDASGGTWGGCVFDVDRVAKKCGARFSAPRRDSSRRLPLRDAEVPER